MKKIIFLFCVFIGSLSFGQNFPGKYVNLLIGKDIKVLPKDKELQEYGYEKFYTDEKLKEKFACCESYNSKYLSLVGKTFKVISYEKFKDILGAEKSKIMLSNSETGTIFYEYDPERETDFPFEVIGGLSMPKGFYNEYIEMRVDKFTGDTTFSSIPSDGISFIKVKNGTKSAIYLSIKKTGTTISIGEKGLIILLENKLKIEKPNEKIDVKPGYKSYYDYSAFVELTSSDIKYLTQHSMTDARLYVYDRTIQNGPTLKEYLKCLLSK